MHQICYSHPGQFLLKNKAKQKQKKHWASIHIRMFLKALFSVLPNTSLEFLFKSIHILYKTGRFTGSSQDFLYFDSLAWAGNVPLPFLPSPSRPSLSGEAHCVLCPCGSLPSPSLSSPRLSERAVLLTWTVAIPCKFLVAPVLCSFSSSVILLPMWSSKRQRGVCLFGA